MNCSPPGSSVHGTSQARILSRVATSSFRGLFLTQGSTMCLPVDSLPLSHQGSPWCHFKVPTIKKSDFILCQAHDLQTCVAATFNPVPIEQMDTNRRLKSPCLSQALALCPQSRILSNLCIKYSYNWFP